MKIKYLIDSNLRMVMIFCEKDLVTSGNIQIEIDRQIYLLLQNKFLDMKDSYWD